MFTVSNGSVKLVLTNLEQNITADGQEISGITFDVSGATGIGSVSGVGTQATIDTSKSGKGAYTLLASTDLAHWAGSLSKGSIDFTTLSGKKPNELIIGPDDHGGFDPTKGKFSNANSSVGQHNPNVLGVGTFTIDLTGVTALSKISNVSFQFGTGPETVAAAPVPEAGTMLGFAGMMALGGVGLLRRKRG